MALCKHGCGTSFHSIVVRKNHEKACSEGWSVSFQHKLGSTWRVVNKKDNPGTLRLVVCKLKIMYESPYYDLIVVEDTRRFPVYRDRDKAPIAEVLTNAAWYGYMLEVEEAWFNREDVKKGWTHGD